MKIRDVFTKVLLEDHRPNKWYWVFGYRGWVKTNQRDIKDVFEIQNTEDITRRVKLDLIKSKK